MDGQDRFADEFKRAVMAQLVERGQRRGRAAGDLNQGRTLTPRPRRAMALDFQQGPPEQPYRRQHNRPETENGRLCSPNAPH